MKAAGVYPVWQGAVVAQFVIASASGEAAAGSTSPVRDHVRISSCFGYKI